MVNTVTILRERVNSDTILVGRTYKIVSHKISCE